MSKHKKEAQRMEATELDRAAGAEVIAFAKGAAGAAQDPGKLKILGTLVNMSVPQANYPRKDLIAAMEDAGLGEEFAPREPSERDAFRRATRSLRVNRVPVDATAPQRLFGNERRYANVLIRDARTSGPSIVRLAVREVVDSAGAVLDYENVAHLELDSGGRLDAYPLVAGLLPEERDVIQRAQEAYEVAKSHHDDGAVRNVITRALGGARGLPMLPSGGAYFVPAEHEATVLAAYRFVSELNERLGEKAPRIIFIPTDLVDKESAREDLVAALADKVKRDARGLRNEMTQVLKKGTKITQLRQEDLFERVRALKRYVSDYEAILEREMTDNRADLELAQKQAVSLLSQVEVR